MRVAFVHDWLVTWRGGEKVLEALLELYPNAPIYTLFYDEAEMPESIRRRQVIVDPWLNALKRFRKILLPLLPAAIEAMPLEDYDLVISTSSCVAKGVLVGAEARHISYIHSPMRYIWDQRRYYLTPHRPLSWVEMIKHILLSKLRVWDVASNHRVDRFVANSSFVRSRVKRYYGRDAQVVHPPVAIERFKPQNPKKGGYFLAAGAFVNYKRFDLAIAACEALGKKLIVAGSGPDEKQLRRLAGKMTEFRVKPSADEWVALFQNADALLFPGVEDFGITAIEALAAGTPVIALKAGGALDFIQEGKTGLFFQEATVESLRQTLENFQSQAFHRDYLTTFAATFSRDNFQRRMRQEIDAIVKDRA
ncbi:MAG TPA: glycosyltransferase [Oligoflexus sp.]|uniref:glycosyltransferase n=1 Tax=Oligoflexus sp. TaxID=1971216 RepID=UPI002D53D0E5|nr:glycosyltransferase [Oligoflexus sp.]HYX32089.1 glycosyltransferase [Oligoflexus sp.]